MFFAESRRKRQKIGSSACEMQKLPDELLWHIMDYLSPEDAARFARTHKKAQRLFLDLHFLDRCLFPKFESSYWQVGRYVESKSADCYNDSEDPIPLETASPENDLLIHFEGFTQDQIHFHVGAKWPKRKSSNDIQQQIDLVVYVQKVTSVEQNLIRNQKSPYASVGFEHQYEELQGRDIQIMWFAIDYCLQELMLLAQKTKRFPLSDDCQTIKYRLYHPCFKLMPPVLHWYHFGKYHLSLIQTSSPTKLYKKLMNKMIHCYENSE